MKLDIETIRKAIQANRGGHKDTSDAGLMKIWNALPPDVQKQYLESIKPAAKAGKEKTDASGDKT